MKLFQTMTIAAMLALATPAYAKDKKLQGPEVVEIADISVALNGLVCDFCSIALNKTFKKKDAVRGTYVDLDSKVLSIALKEAGELTRDEIIETVRRAGYTATKITYSDGTIFVPES